MNAETLFAKMKARFSVLQRATGNENHLCIACLKSSFFNLCINYTAEEKKRPVF
jgi:hypothetical protein